MPKMHELLAVESAATANYQRDFQESLKVLGRADLFQRQIKTKTFFDSEDSKLNTVETKDITTTVSERLKWFSNAAIKFYDVVLQKDRTNQKAVADLVTEDGTVIAKDVPATTLLMFETKLQDLRKVLEAAPTLPAGIKWQWDENERLFVTSEPVVTFQTKKTPKPVVMYEATKEHPAQVKEVFEDQAVARIEQVAYVGMLTSGQKADLLGRLDDLLQACKKARQRANQTEADTSKIGASLFKYLFGETVK